MYNAVILVTKPTVPLINKFPMWSY